MTVITIDKNAEQSALLRDEIVTLQNGYDACSYEIARRLKQIRDEKRFRHLGYETFPQFVSHETGFAQSTVRNNIANYERFQDIKQANNLAEKDFLQIGMKRMSIMGNLALNNKELIDLALTGSTRDLINATRQMKGKPEMALPPSYPSSASNYQEYIKESGCVVCGRRPIDQHHYPHTRATGKDLRKKIPLCRVCHTEFHNTAWSDWQYHRQAIDYLFKYIFKDENG